MLIGAQLEKTKMFVVFFFFHYFSLLNWNLCCLSSAPTHMTHPIVSLFLQYLGRWSHYHDDCEISLPCRVRVYPEGRKIEGNMGREELWSCYFFVGLFFFFAFLH